MHLPNYKDGSIVNLMSSIARVIGSTTKTPYKPLKGFDINRLKKPKNIVLLVVDGLGYEFLQRHKDSFLSRNTQKKITSVFLSATTCAIPVFLTGVPAQQHGLTGWYTFFKELGILSTALPFMPRFKGLPLSFLGINPKKIFTAKSLYYKTKIPCYIVFDHLIADSDFTVSFAGNAKRIAYKEKSMDSFFKQLKKTIEKKNRKKFVYSYWPGIDALAHDYGLNSKKTVRHFREFDKKLNGFVKSLKRTDTILIITADHGLIDPGKNRKIDLNRHPVLKDCLTMPLAGEPRMSYCYVHPSKAKTFEKYVKTKLKQACWLYKSEELINKNFFGLGKPNPKLKERIGDYALIMKEDYVIKDNILDKKTRFNNGDHGSVSKEEMYVPLIVIDC